MLHYTGNFAGKKRIKTKKLTSLLYRVINRETVLYLVFGVLTTVVSYVSALIFYSTLPLDGTALNMVSNILSWILSVSFAFVTNKLFVFQSKSWDKKRMLRELPSFVSARLLSLGVELAGMWLLVDCLLVPFALSKLLINVVVVILNYVFSKWLIFTKK